MFPRHDGMDQDEGGVWTTSVSDQVAWFADPDGNVTSLTLPFRTYARNIAR